MESLLYIVLSVVGVFVVLQLVMRAATFLKKGKKVEGVKGRLGRDIASGRKNLIYFYSPACAACKTMTIVIEKLQKEFKNIHKINLAIDRDAGRIFGVLGTPALIRVENKKISSYQLGARNEAMIRKLLN